MDPLDYDEARQRLRAIVEDDRPPGPHAELSKAIDDLYLALQRELRESGWMLLLGFLLGVAFVIVLLGLTGNLR